MIRDFKSCLFLKNWSTSVMEQGNSTWRSSTNAGNNQGLNWQNMNLHFWSQRNQFYPIKFKISPSHKHYTIAKREATRAKKYEIFWWNIRLVLHSIRVLMRCIFLVARAKASLKIWHQGRVMLLPLYQPVKDTKRLTTTTFIYTLLCCF